MNNEGEDQLSDAISDFCTLCKKPVIVIINEVDQAENYETFIKLLSLPEIVKQYLRCSPCPS